MPLYPSESEALKHWHLVGLNRIIGSYTSSPSPPLIFNISSSHHIIWYDTPPALGYGVPWWLDDSVKIKNLNVRFRLASIWDKLTSCQLSLVHHFNDSNSGSEALKTLQSSSPAVAHRCLDTAGVSPLRETVRNRHLHDYSANFHALTKLLVDYAHMWSFVCAHSYRLLPGVYPKSIYCCPHGAHVFLGYRLCN